MMLTQLIKQNKMLKKIIFKIKKDLYHYKMQLNKMLCNIKTHEIGKIQNVAEIIRKESIVIMHGSRD